MRKVTDFQGDPFAGVQLTHGIQGLIARGTEHLVHNHAYFDLLAQQGVPSAAVVKKLSLIALKACNNGTPEENIALACDLAEQRNRRHVQLRTVFGPDIVPEESTQACRLYLNRDRILQLWPDRQVTGPGDVFYATLTWQDKVWELDSAHYDSANVLQFRLPYAERQKQFVSDGEYAAANERWITNAADVTVPSAAETAQLVRVQRGPWLADVLSAAKKSKAFCLALGRVVAGAIEYGQLYDEPLDFMGEHNAIITKDGQARLIDVLIPPEIPFLRQLPEVLQKVEDNQGLTRWDYIVLLNSLSHVRNMNFLAAWLGLPGRLTQGAGVLQSPNRWNMVHQVLTQASDTNDLLAATHSYTMSA
jgi:hypothetical protein